MARQHDFVAAQGRPLLAHRLRRLSELFVQGYGDWLPTIGVTAPPRALSLLRLLDERGPLGITEIASRLRLTHPLIIGLAGDLELLGLTEIRRDPGDARRRLVALSEAGRKQAALVKHAFVVLGAAYARLTAETGLDLFAALEGAERACADISFTRRLEEAAAQLAEEEKIACD